jgi:hypothetical protein
VGEGGGGILEISSHSFTTLTNQRCLRDPRAALAHVSLRGRDACVHSLTLLQRSRKANVALSVVDVEQKITHTQACVRPCVVLSGHLGTHLRRPWDARHCHNNVHRGGSGGALALAWCGEPALQRAHFAFDVDERCSPNECSQHERTRLSSNASSSGQHLCACRCSLRRSLRSTDC